MFKTIKEQTDIVDVICHFVDEDSKAVGENVTLESDTCPFCGHKECFRIKPNGFDSFFKCFSCDRHGDAIRFIEEYKELSPVDACKLIAHEFKVTLPLGSPVQEIFTLAARYYRNCLLETSNKPYPELNGLTPLQYQTQIRGHKESTLEALQVGWSDGGLIDYLRGVGIDDDMLEQSGLMNKAKKDFLPSKTFIYPHFVRGRASHFTFKDPLKKLAYQLKNSSKLNGHSWYNQDAVKDSNTVILVEGENDLASILDSEWQNVIASIGSLGGTQVEWLLENCGSKHVITLFDPDDAGDKYRDKIEKVKNKFQSLKQITPADGIDIDEHLRAGKKLGDIISSSKEPILNVLEEGETEEEVEIVGTPVNGNMFAKDNCYYINKVDKDGAYKPRLISTFVMHLRNVFIHENNRARELVFVRADGKTSKPVSVSSEVKTSLKAFKTFVANVIDASFKGTEADLAEVWEYVYAQGGENEVTITDHVGRNECGWIMHNCLVTHSGRVLLPDTSGIFWKEGKGETNSTGIRAISINSLKSFTDSELEIPEFDTSMDKETAKQFYLEFVNNLKLNLDDIGKTVLLLSWAKAVAYSDWFIKTYGHFPGIYLSGGAGRGKTTITRWILDLYNMRKCGHIMISSMKSIVATERKLAYYSSLPICIDELRNDEQTKALGSTFRNWYDRSGRDLGTNQDTISVRTLPVRGCLFYSGQDTISDQATKQRNIQVKIPKIKGSNRNTTDTFNWIDNHKDQLSSIGYTWVMESQVRDLYSLKKEIDEFNTLLEIADVSEPRFRINYSLLYVMGKDIAKEFFPSFDWLAFLRGEATASNTSNQEDNLINRFFDCAETLTIGDHPKINPDNYRVEKNQLIIWFNSFYTEVSKELKHQGNLDSDFSKNSLIDVLMEEEWFISKDVKKRVGMDNKLRTVLTIDLDKAPENIRLFAAYIKKEQENGKE